LLRWRRWPVRQQEEFTVTKLSVTIPEAIEMTGLGRSTIYRLFAERKLTPRKSGKRTLILVDDLKRYIESLPVAGGGNAAA
jgi:excisionase family DNA binding protein